ncbi:hypothetical protein CFFPNG_01393 [Methylorubrum aminovorans]
MLFRPTDTLRDISVVLREDQVDWLNGLTACDEEHDSRSETLRRIIDFARDTIESEISLAEDDVLLSDDALVPFNQPLA